jgi:ribA/ribD-fused uncharacterized protein
MDILEFRGATRWLSNFHSSPVMFDGVTYPTVENAYQAAKTDPAHREQFVSVAPAKARKLGQTVPLCADWEDVKVTVMRSLIAQKFAPGTELGDRLVATGDVRLVEGNDWGDTFWGVCKGRGKNMLGRLLMDQREKLKGGA